MWAARASVQWPALALGLATIAAMLVMRKLAPKLPSLPVIVAPAGLAHVLRGVEVQVDGQFRTASAVGNGPLDAVLKAADAALGLDLELLEMNTRAVRRKLRSSVPVN